MAVIWITHDLGVIARLAKRVNVMYGGYDRGDGADQALFRHPAHPYTMGLLGSLPGAGRSQERRPAPISRVRPPDMINLPPGCPFWPRCSYPHQGVRGERPELADVNGGASCSVLAH